MQGGCNEVVKDAVRSFQGCNAGVLGVWAAIWTGCILALALGLHGTAYADTQYQPSLAGVVQGPTPWAVYQAEEYYDGYLVYGANKYDCLLYALDLNPNDFDLVARAKLSNPSTGGKFYEVVQEGYNTNCPAWVSIPFYEGWLRQSGVTPGTGNYPQYLWAFEIYPDDYAQAREDAEIVRNGGDVGGDSGGGSGSGGSETIEGNNITFTLAPVMAVYDNAKINSTWGYKYNGSKIYTMKGADGGSDAPSLNFDVTFNSNIDIENAKIVAYITPTSSGTVTLQCYIGNALTVETLPQESSHSGYPDTTMPGKSYVNAVRFTRQGDYYYFSKSMSNLTDDNVLTNVNVSKYTNASTTTITIGTGKPYEGFYFTDDGTSGGSGGSGGGSGGEDEPSPDPWPDPEPTTPTPQPPELPEPGDPTQPVEPTVPTPDPPSPPVIQYPDPGAPEPDTGDPVSDNDFTPDLQGILDALDEHCMHLQEKMAACSEYLSSWLWYALKWEGNQLIVTIEFMQRYLGNNLNYNFQTLITDNHNLVEYLADRIGNDIAALVDYLEECTIWLDKKLDYQFPTFDDNSIVYWLKRLYYKKGTGTDSRPVDPVTDPFGIGEWLRNLANLLIQALEGLAPGLVGDLLEKIDLLTGKFPFSLPWDIMAVLGAFVAQPEAPSVEWPCYTYQNGQVVQVATYDVDMSAYDGVMEGVRFVGFLGFAVYTMTLVPKWVDDLTGVVESA